MNPSRADSRVNCLRTSDVSETHSVSILRESDLAFSWGWRLSVSPKRRRFLNNWHGYQPENSSYKRVHLTDVTHSIVYIVLATKCFGSFRIIIMETCQGRYNYTMVLTDTYNCTIIHSLTHLPNDGSKRRETCRGQYSIKSRMSNIKEAYLVLDK
jgi:hypothetical protein